MNREDWSDDRLDDLNQEVRTQGDAIHYWSLEHTKLEGEVRVIKEAHTRSVNIRFQWWMLAVTAISSPLTALVTYLFTKGK